MPEYIIQLSLAVLLGALIGFEREYHSKAAGFRTITMITLGSTLFTILSLKLGGAGSEDRLAANIVTGVGFLGAGVIFRDGFGVSGLTTAATIWVSAAVGIGLGLGEYLMAIITTTFAIGVLALFERVQDAIENINEVRTFTLVFGNNHEEPKKVAEEKLSALNLKFKIKRTKRDGDDICFLYRISGKAKNMETFIAFLVNMRELKRFDE